MKKKSQLKQQYATTFRPLTKKNHSFSIPEHSFDPLYHACTKFHAILSTYPIKSNDPTTKVQMLYTF